MSSLPLIFSPHFFTNNLYSFGPNNPSCKYGYFTPHRRYSVDQVPPLLVIGHDVTLDTKIIHGCVRVSHPSAGSEKLFFAFNSTSISVEYNQRSYYK